MSPEPRTARAFSAVRLWLTRLMGRPGSLSVERYAGAVQIAATLAAATRERGDAELRDAAGRAMTIAPQAPGRAGQLAAVPSEQLAGFLAAAGELARRALGTTPTDEQLLACCVLLDGCGVDMATGEGKTLVGALAAAGHALRGRQVHVITVNDYLAERDATWMRPLYTALGVEVRWVGQRTRHDERRGAYRADVVYAPISEIGFDVLRDRFAFADADRVLPVQDVAIVDEADSALIDEALTPLVLAEAPESAVSELAFVAELVAPLAPGTDFTVAADRSTVTLTDDGIDSLEARLGGRNLYAGDGLPLLTQINLALHAREILHRDVDYIVRDGVVQLLNVGRGRIAHGQRWPDGLHAAIEAKEGLAPSTGGRVLDSLTVQDLVTGYRTLSGMSGTLMEVASELDEHYGLRSARIPPHRANARIDAPDRVFITSAERNREVIAEAARRHASGQPVLVGTQSVVASEALAEALLTAGLKPRVLNAKNDAEEAAIIAAAGELGALTVSTQISGRGTDIPLGGAHGAERTLLTALGGLAVIAVGRAPTARLDRQLSGRCGRQGEPGSALTFVSLEDDLVQQHAPAHLLTAINRQREALPAAERARIVAVSQRISEGVRRDRHRATWEYQRAIAAQRATVLRYRERVRTDATGLDAVRDRVPAPLWGADAGKPAPGSEPTDDGEHGDHARNVPAALITTVREVTLHFLDESWGAHLAVLQEIRDGIHLRALAGQRPADEFHRIALREFSGFFSTVNEGVAEFIQRLTPADLGRSAANLGLHRPSTTWTYMVTDDPFGSASDRAVRRLGASWRSKVLNIE